MSLRPFLCALLLLVASVTHGAILDLDAAAAITLQQPGLTCQQAAAAGQCSAFDGTVAYLCAPRCQPAQAVDVCMDSDVQLSRYWASTISEEDGNMTCARARLALACTREPVASLCAATCLQCTNDVHKSVAVDEADVLQLEYNSEVLQAEARQAEYQCALARQEADYACGSQLVRCPDY